MHLLKNRSTTFIFSTILNYFHHFQPFLLCKKCAYLKEVIRRDFDQCEFNSLLPGAVGNHRICHVFFVLHKKYEADTNGLVALKQAIPLCHSLQNLSLGKVFFGGGYRS